MSVILKVLLITLELEFIILMLLKIKEDDLKNKKINAKQAFICLKTKIR